MRGWVLLALFVWVPVSASDVSATLRVVPEYHDVNRSSEFFLPDATNPLPQQRSHQVLEIQSALKGFHLLGTLSNFVARHKKPENDAVLNELYLDFSLENEDFSIGKKVMSWGVGFGFRPLDLLQRENRRRLYQNTLEGVSLLAWEHFTRSGAVTLVYANPGAGNHADVIDDESFAFKYYQLLGDTDLQVVARWSEQNQWEAGGGFAQVVNDNLEWHGSLLYQQHYGQLQHRLLRTGGDTLLATSNPVEVHTANDGIKAVLGMSWTSMSGWSTLLEAWYDDAAYSKRQWRSIVKLTQQQRILLGQPGVPDAAVFGNIAWNSQVFSASNWLRQNLLLRIAHNGETLDPALDLLYTPEDGGWVTTATLGIEGNQQRVDLKLRYFSGPDTAAYQIFPEQLSMLVRWQWAFE